MKEYIINETLARMERRAEIALKHVSEDNDTEKAERWKRAMEHYTCAAEALKEITALYYAGDGWWYDRARKVLGRAVAWQPLPEPYKPSNQAAVQKGDNP